MYHDFFGLREAPFRITPNTEFFFGGGNRGAILDALLYAISQGEGIVKVTGEVGSGKTMLCRMLQAQLPPEVLGVYLANPSVSPDEILHAVAHELELDLPPGAGRLEAMQRITAFLLDCHAQNHQVVLFVEESQGMPIGTLEEIRLLSNLETDRHKLLQIVLFGQPELDTLLRKPEIRQFRERITHSFTLAPLSAADIGLYLNFRLRAAGFKGPDVFGARVVSQIAQASAGLTRRVNLLGDKTLLAAFSESTHAVAPRHVRAAIRDSEFAQNSSLAARWRWPVAAGSLAVAALLIAAVWLRAGPAGPSAPAEAGLTAGRIVAAPEVPPGVPPPLPVPVTPASADKTEAAADPAVVLPAALPAAPAPPPPPPAAPAVAEAAIPGPPAVASLASGAGSGQAQSAPVEGTLLEARIVATRAWLGSAPPGTISIQIMGSRSALELDRQLRRLSRQLDAGQLFVIRTQAGERPSMTVLYGSFPNRAEASAALAALPESIRGFSPHLRTVQGVRAEIAAAGS